MSLDLERFRRVEELFHRIRQLPAAGRRAELEGACAGDAELAREVADLLAEDEPDSIDLHLTERLREDLSAGGPDVNLGRRIGPYEITRRLGAGGMGVVYLAVQTEPVSRTVALKVIRRGLDTEETVRRFRTERQVLAGLRHPHIAQLLDGGSTDDGLPYFVMEYVEGLPITTYCETQRLGLAQRLRLFQQVCAAVHFAHQNTVIHRDLKPANILVTAEGVPKLLDFGVAKLTSGDHGGVPDLTRTECRFMTPEYASPEQIRGGPVTTGSDVYSLGVVLYELLAGTRPWQTRGLSRAEVEGLICSDREPLRPSEALRRQAGRPADRPVQRLRIDLDNIAMMAIRKEPGLRYASAEQLSADLQRYLNNEPVLASGLGTMYRLRKFARRNKAACAFVAALILGLIGSAWATSWALQARDQARLAEEAARDRAERLRKAASVRDVTLAHMDSRAHLVGGMRRRLEAVPEDLREWEWHYLHSIMDDSLQVWRGHEGGVNAVACSPDGRWVASGGEDEIVRIWDAATGRQTFVLRGHKGGVGCVRFSPDSTRVVSGGADGIVRIWDFRTATCVARLDEKGGTVRAARYSPDGEWLAVAAANGVVTLYEVRSNQPVHTIPGASSRHDALAFSTDSRRLALGGDDGAVRIHDARTGALVRTFGGPAAPVCGVDFSKDGQMLLAGWYLRGAHVLDTGNWTIIRRLMLQPVWAVVFSPDAQRVASTGDEDATLRVSLWNTREARMLQGHDRRVLGIAYSPDGRRIYTASRDGALRVWDGAPVREPSHLGDHPGGVSCLAISPDSRLLVTGDGHSIRFWDVLRRTEIRRISGHQARLTGACFSADGRQLATCTADGKVMIWNAGSAAAICEAPRHSSSVSAVAWSPDGGLLASADDDGLVQIWNRAAGGPPLHLRGHEGRVLAVAFSRDGRWLATGGADGRIFRWDTSTGAPAPPIETHAGGVYALAVDPSGAVLVSGGADRTIRRWSVRTWQPMGEPLDVGEPVRAVAFSPRGKRIAVACAEGPLRIWDPDTSEEALALRGTQAGATSVAFSPDGRLLVSAGDDQVVRFWDATSYRERLAMREGFAQWGAHAEELLDRCMEGAADWNQVAEALWDTGGANAASAPTSHPTTNAMAQPTFDPVRREALNRLLARASEGLPLAAEWSLEFFGWHPAADAADLDAKWRAAREGPHVVRTTARRLDFNWDDHDPAGTVRRTHFGLIARASFEATAGRHRFVVQSDDGVRVWIDDRLVIDHWDSHAPATDAAEVDLKAGAHALRVEYYQIIGPARLRLSRELLGPTTAPASSRPD